MLPINELQCFNEIQCIRTVKSAVFEFPEAAQVAWLVITDKIIGGIVHPGHQFTALPNDRCPLTPREHCGKEASDLDILLFAEPVWNTYRVVRNKIGSVELVDLFIKKRLEVSEFF